MDNRFPVSIKGVLTIGDKFVLLKNEREEWELPGGRIEAGESPELYLVREIEEELGLKPVVNGILDTWLYEVLPGKQVFIATYSCTGTGMTAEQIQISHEHKEVGLFHLEAALALNMPVGYKRSLANYSAQNQFK
ncbi:MAG: NUDIX domain-containing protein [Sphingobacteriales bacterium]|nr:MAG: NUDIX domain-containing protein [Sphingobacteriales bacterium]